MVNAILFLIFIEKHMLRNYWLDKKLTVLDRVCVRRLVFYIRKNALKIIQDNLEAGTDKHIGHTIWIFLVSLHSRKAFYNYSLAESENKYKIGIQTKSDTDFIFIEFTVKDIE